MFDPDDDGEVWTWWEAEYVITDEHGMDWEVGYIWEAHEIGDPDDPDPDPGDEKPPEQGHDELDDGVGATVVRGHFGKAR